MAENTSKQRFDIKQKREVPISQDLAFAAMKMFPGYDQQTALTLYLIDQNEKQQQTDNEQSKLIQAQKSQNEKLTGAVKSIGQELDDLEKQSIETDTELQRLKDLSGKLKPAADIQQQAMKVSSEELKNLEQQVMALKSQPGMNKEKFDLLVKYVEDVKSNKSLDPNDLGKIENLIKNLSNKQGASDELFNKTMGELEKTKQQLDRKEERFKEYIRKKGSEAVERAKGSAEEMKKYADIVANYKDEIESFKKEVDKRREEFDSLRSYMTDQLGKINDAADRLEIRSKLQPPVVKAQQVKAQQDPVSTDEPTKAQKDLALTTIQKAQDTSKKGDLSSLGSEYIKQGEIDRRYTQMAKQFTGALQEQRIFPAQSYEDKNYEEWLTKNLPIMVKMFKSKYWESLENKHPSYGDQQIAYTLEEFTPWLYNHKAEIITKEIMDKFLGAVKAELWTQPVEPEQSEFDFRESLDKIYENMLDQIINETLSKRR